jgi:hypothetical protein
MSHTYTSQYPPDVKVDQSVRDFFSSFYRISDTPDTHENYVRQFTQDATFILASKTAKGHDGTPLPSHSLLSPVLPARSPFLYTLT